MCFEEPAPWSGRDVCLRITLFQVMGPVSSATKMLRAVPAKTEPDDEFMSGSAPTTHPPSSPDVNAKAVPVYPATGPGDEKKPFHFRLFPNKWKDWDFE